MKNFIATILLVILILVGCTAMAEGWMKVTGQTVNVRVAPNIDSQSIGIAREGMRFYVFNKIHTKDGRTWCQVEWNGNDAYISEMYLKDCDEEETCDDSNDDNYLELSEFIVTSNTLVRAWTDMNADSLGLISKGTHVFGNMLYPADDGRVWLEIEMTNGEYGYISTRELRKVYGTLPKFGNNSLANKNGCILMVGERTLHTIQSYIGSKEVSV